VPCLRLDEWLLHGCPIACFRDIHIGSKFVEHKPGENEALKSDFSLTAVNL